MTPDKLFGTTMTLGCLSEYDFPNNKHPLYKTFCKKKQKKQVIRTKFHVLLQLNVSFLFVKKEHSHVFSFLFPLERKEQKDD
jgi:hypothetical protein